MTHYWWMHWFWITTFYNLQVFVVFGHTILTNLHSNPPTTAVPTIQNLSEISNISIEGIPKIPPINKSPVVLRNITQYARNVSMSRKLNVLPLEVPSRNNNLSELDNSGANLTVISQNVSDSSGNSTGFLENRNFGTVGGSNHSENISYLGEELSYNHSFVQSERIGIEEEDLDIEDSAGNFSAAGITGITLGCIVVVGVICGVSFFVYHNQGFNRPQVLNDRCSNPDSSGYIDDASVRDNSEEMYSLDNDSFLNSLEAMTIQNYWTDTVKHTKL
ncbi:unnamed protein product [Ceutorhynchus assimilis]|uniref:Uncharacterized protein n=1 Tax=Ceutorhynchus assimilis TaxID=467358 RepID=A0A9N9MQC6_9CUCU|nr:unnamed protein product [Ceutorhynchus assimilis]